METPSVPLSVWPLAAFDPILIAVACYLGWKADQYGKIVVAVIAAIAASVLGSYFLTRLGVPWIAPVGGERPMLLPVRLVASTLWASLAYGAARLAARRRR